VSRGVAVIRRAEPRQGRNETIAPIDVFAPRGLTPGYFATYPTAYAVATDLSSASPTGVLSNSIASRRELDYGSFARDIGFVLFPPANNDPRNHPKSGRTERFV
jgi:hypothetical protein